MTARDYSLATDGDTSSFRWGFTLAVVALLLVLRPIEAPDLWWHLARGREAASGQLAPSRHLLLLDGANEAAWLSGVPCYLWWSLGGIYALSAVPVLATAVLAGFVLWRLPKPVFPFYLLMLTPLFLWTIRDGLQPVPELWDLVGMILLWRILRANWTASSRLIAITLLFVLWGNFGPRPVWGLLFLICFASSESLTLKMLAAAVVGGMLTPRAAYTWLDAARLLAPSVFVPIGPFSDVAWRNLFMDQPRDASQLAFAVLWCALVIPAALRKPEFLQWVRWMVPLLAALLCRANLPLCGLWLLLDTLQSLPAEHPAPIHPAKPSQANRRKPLHVPAPAMVQAIENVPSSGPGGLVNMRWGRPLRILWSLLLLGCVLMDAAGSGLPPYTRLGAGISAQLDPRLLNFGLFDNLPEPVTAWAADGRSAGILAFWEPKIRLLDHPQRALLGGRWPRHAGLIYDLQSNRGPRYRRDNGDWGGWMHTLTEWPARLLALPQEEVQFHRAKIDYPWLPADLDSPLVPYFTVSDLLFSPLLQVVQHERSFAEYGHWQPTLEIFDGQGWRCDLIEQLGLGPDPAPALRQSAFFRALNNPLAALRVLLPVRRRTAGSRLLAEFAACQNVAATQEWEGFGEASEFRQRVWRALETALGRSAAVPWAVPLAPQDPAAQAAWDHCLSAYLRGDLDGSIRSLDAHASEDPQRLYACGMLYLEKGEPGLALARFERLLTLSAEGPLAMIARKWKSLLSSSPES